jgi:hypothetical protein
LIDSQSVKADAVVGADSRGFDGGKLVNGRKRPAVVDTLGLLLAVMVTAADTQDRAMFVLVATVLRHRVLRANSSRSRLVDRSRSKSQGGGAHSSRSCAER